MWDEFRRPATYVGWLVALIVGAVFFFVSRDVTELAYDVSRVTVYDRLQEAPGIRVVDASGMLVDESIFIDEYRVWNSGDVTIDDENLRRPLRFAVNGPGEIRDATVLAATYPDVTDPTAHIESGGQETVLRWALLDEGHGLLVRLTYSGEAATQTYPEILLRSGELRKISTSYQYIISIILIITSANLLVTCISYFLTTLSKIKPAVTERNISLNRSHSFVLSVITIIFTLILLSSLIFQEWAIFGPAFPEDDLVSMVGPGNGGPNSDAGGTGGDGCGGIPGPCGDGS